MQSENIVRIIIDANVWVSFFRSIAFRQRCHWFFNSNRLLVFCEQLLNEIDKASHYPKNAERIDWAVYAEITRFLKDKAEWCDVQSTVNVCRDPNDNYILALALDGEADYLITGDNDLLMLKQFGQTKIVSITVFENEMQSNMLC
jgi:putative PIN family toxin of toxin-antitoxin system